MKKIASMTLTFALIGVAYTASAWFLGKNVEASIDEQYNNLSASQPYIRVVKREYQRGIFQSEETVTLSLVSNLPSSTANQDGLPGGASDRPMELTLHTRIQHGPFPGFSTLGAATSETELVLSDESKAGMAKLLGDANPFLQHSVIHFDGSGTARFSSPRFDFSFPGKGSQIHHIAWEGVEGSMDFTPGVKSFTLHMQAPKLEITDAQGGAISLDHIVFEGDQQQMFQDLPYLYSGTSHFAIGKISVNDGEGKLGPMAINQLVYDVELPLQGDYLDLITRVGTDGLTIDKDSFGPAHMDISFRHIHARAAAELNKQLMLFYTDPALQSSNPKELAGLLLSQLKQNAETILANDPQINIDRISFSNPDGEAKLAARVKLIDITLEEVANPMMMLMKLEATGNLTLPEEMIVQLLRNPPFAKQAKFADLTPEEIKARGQAAAKQFQQQVAMLTEQGYLNREDNLIKTSMAFKAGQLTINGKPFSPGAGGGSRMP
jgi:uncharacterized protein YdgA (DUF945 family)